MEKDTIINLLKSIEVLAHLSCSFLQEKETWYRMYCEQQDRIQTLLGKVGESKK